MAFLLKAEKHPTRCEICHQSDQFDPVANHCTRCQGVVERHRPASQRVVWKIVAGVGLALIVIVSLGAGAITLWVSWIRSLEKQPPPIVKEIDPIRPLTVDLLTEQINKNLTPGTSDVPQVLNFLETRTLQHDPLKPVTADDVFCTENRSQDLKESHYLIIEKNIKHKITAWTPITGRNYLHHWIIVMRFYFDENQKLVCSSVCHWPVDPGYPRPTS
ncbi:MAG TPA: hypothetical protein PKZ53_17070 [Acidobacteriota bacterium]|nr:hypothetical protein [Acidobacteriota bacterium]